MTLYDLLLISLASLYVAHVFTTQDGPFRVFLWIRDHLRKPLGGLMGCFFCLIAWVALLMVVVYQVAPQAVWIFAIAGAAVLARSYTGLRHD